MVELKLVYLKNVLGLNFLWIRVFINGYSKEMDILILWLFMYFYLCELVIFLVFLIICFDVKLFYDGDMLVFLVFIYYIGGI